MKKQHKHLIILITLLTVLFGANELAWAADRTFTVKSHDIATGRVRYKKGSGSWSAWSDSHSVTAADGVEITLDAESKNASGVETNWGFRAWIITPGSFPDAGTSVAQYKFRVSSTYAGQTFEAYFDAWGGDLKAGATYLVTNVGESNRINVTSGIDHRYDGKTFEGIGRITANFEDPAEKAIIEFNTARLVWSYDRICPQSLRVQWNPNLRHLRHQRPSDLQEYRFPWQ